MSQPKPNNRRELEAHITAKAEKDPRLSQGADG